MSAAPPEPGDAFAGHVIEDVIGRGGMGVVLRARNVALDRIRALKIVAPELSADPAFAARFRREARLAASVEHPNVVTVHHAGEEDGLLYLVMRYVDGYDLARLLEDGPLPPARALAILRSLADALDAAHAAGLVHRDVKPANVLIEDLPGGERVYLTDFGISRPLTARATSEATATTALTGGGQVIGTADYVSPEAIEGGTVDARSDVYSLACLAYHLLTGRPPFARDTELATLVAHAKAERPAATALNPALPKATDSALRRGMAIEPEERPGSAGAFASALERAVGIDAQDDSRVHRQPRRWAIAAVALLLAAALVGAGALLLGGDDAGEPAEADPVVVTGEVGDGPTGVAVGDVRIWVASREAGEVARLRRDRPVEALPPIPVPDPRSVAVGFGSVWVVNGESLFRLDPESDRPASEVETGKGPVDVTTDASYVWVANEEDDTVTRFNPLEPADTETVDVGEGPRSIAAGGSAIWVANAGDGTVSRISRQDVEVTATIPVGSRPTSIAAGTKSVWVADSEDATLTEIEEGNRPGEPIALADDPRGVAVGLGAIWVASAGANAVERFDPATGDPAGDPIPVDGEEPSDIAVGDAAVYTANFGDGTVSRIDPDG